MVLGTRLTVEAELTMVVSRVTEQLIMSAAASGYNNHPSKEPQPSINISVSDHRRKVLAQLVAP